MCFNYVFDYVVTVATVPTEMQICANAANAPDRNRGAPWLQLKYNLSIPQA